MMKNKEQTINFGSFEVNPVYVGSELIAYEARSKSGNFRLRFGINTNMFKIFHRFRDDDSMLEYLEVLINMAYQMTMLLPDEKFMSGYADLTMELLERVANYDKDKSEKASLDDMRVIALAQDIDDAYGTSMFEDNMNILREKEKEYILKN